MELFIQYDIFLFEVTMKTLMKRNVPITGGTGALGTVVAGRFIDAIAHSIIRTDAKKQSMGKKEATGWVSPGEIAETILFLCSDKAQSINGACIPIFGGVS